MLATNKEQVPERDKGDNSAEEPLEGDNGTEECVCESVVNVAVP